MDLGLQGKHVLITGSAGGIGTELAKAYLKQGCNVTLHYNSQKETLIPILKQYPNSTIALATGEIRRKETTF